MSKTLASLALIALLAACGGSSTPQGTQTPTPTATPTETATTTETPTPATTTSPATCSPSGTELELEAENFIFDKACLAAPAGRGFNVKYSNRDSTAHTFSIYRDATGSGPLFRGGNVAGNTEQVFAVPALPAGTWFFRCDIHPDDMNGTFVVA